MTKAVRNVCIFARQNLGQDPPYSKLDLVSCRNVLIYFNRALQDHVIQTFHYAIRGSGFFVTGKTESLRGFSDLFQAVDRNHNLYRRLPGHARPGFELWHKIPSADAGIPWRRGKTKPARWSEADLLHATGRAVLRRYDLPVLVVDESLNIVFTRGETSPFLDITRGPAGHELMHVLRQDMAAGIRAAILRATENDISVEAESVQAPPGGGSFFAVDIVPLPPADERPRCFLILFTPAAGDGAEEGTGLRGAPDRPTGNENESAPRLRKELQSTTRYMQSLIEDRDIKNQELVSASEEIQSQNEELQSANEELQTTKEEIQSANEELQTVNDELHQRNVAVAQAGNDLANLLASVNLPVLMLDNELLIRQFTPAMQGVLSVRHSDIGRPLGDIRLHLIIDDLESKVRNVLDTLEPKDFEVQDRDQRWHLLRIRPYRTSDNKIEGAVLSLLDIDKFRRTQRALTEARDFSRAIIANVATPLVVLNADLTISSANLAFAALVGVSGLDGASGLVGASSLVGRSLSDLAIAQWDMRTLLDRLEAIRAQGPGASFQLEHASALKDRLQLKVHGLVMEIDGEVTFLLLIEDVTTARRAASVVSDERDALKGQAVIDAAELKRTHDELRGLAWKLFTSQEEERRRVALELHDDITQKLALLEMNIDHLAADAQSETLRQGIQPLRRQTASLAEDVRRISHQLHPSFLEDLGLPIALKALIEEFGEREQMPTEFQQAGAPRAIAKDLAGSLYRIVQEALRNVVKHAGKTHVKLSLQEMAHGLRMEVADFGPGFDTNEVHGPRLGIIGMAERARLAGGTFTVHSTLGRGTTISVDVPWPVDQ